MQFTRSIVLLAFAAAHPVAATEICVTCTGPDATYRCTVDNGDTIESFGGTKALGKICKKVLKATGPHGSCKVLELSGTCPGKPKTVGWDEVKDAAAAAFAKPDEKKPAAAETKPADVKSTPPPPPPANAKMGPPRPPETAPAQNAAQPVPPQQPKVATDPQPAPPPPADEPSLGDKVKNAAEKTWDCVASLFGSC